EGGLEAVDAAHDVPAPARGRDDGELAGYAAPLYHVAETVEEVVRDRLRQFAAIQGGRRAVVHVHPVAAEDGHQGTAVVDDEGDGGAGRHGIILRWVRGRRGACSCCNP